MQTVAVPSSSRIIVVDALRGFAVMAIMLVHFVEHFIYNVYPVDSPGWLASLDQGTKDALFFVFAGKSYSIFALLFGFTFAIQYGNQEAKGKDFCGRFLWRMLLLLAFGTLNAAFFPGGDVLVLFAITGCVMILFRKCGPKALFWGALFFLLQPMEIFSSIRMWLDPSWAPAKLLNEAYYPALTISVGSGDFLRMVWDNITTGQLASLFWAVDEGRFLQAPGLFLLGMILVRKNYFADNEENKHFWGKVFLSGAAASFFLYIFKGVEGVPVPVTTILTMWYNLAFTAVLVAGFVLLYRAEWFRELTMGFKSYGRMSLTNYVSQSVIGSLIFFPYALNLAPHVGMLGSLGMGMIVLYLQIKLCEWWLARHKQGVLEGIWHKATWIGSGVKKY